jgi:hypothetical protein
MKIVCLEIVCSDDAAPIIAKIIKEKSKIQHPAVLSATVRILDYEP